MKTVLIVDDKVELRDLVEVTLRGGDYRILQAENGAQALELARAEVPDLMLLDVMMPGGKDGFEVCAELKSDPATAGITIIMLTARGQEVDKARGREVKADGYYTKPFSPLELLQKVEEILGG
ncbi:MAG: response regulator [Candidatus Marinimicrobia bacterium]|nr:response regulator [Candidatus Neomarinimicrobiota bacterium]